MQWERVRNVGGRRSNRQVGPTRGRTFKHHRVDHNSALNAPSARACQQIDEDLPQRPAVAGPFAVVLSALAGIRPQEFRAGETPGLGGTAPTQLPPQNLSLGDFSEKLLTLARQVESRNDMLGVLEAQLFEQAVKKKMIPTMMPVRGPYNASGFGRRVDPFNGQWAMHDGIDFIAEYGSPIVAAAAGVVVFSGFHPQYGYMVDIDHGNDLVTRYAHCSKLVVREGDLVQRGRKIGEVGSTGRSTGPHLHFEVRFRGAPQNPSKFLVSNSHPAVARAK